MARDLLARRLAFILTKLNNGERFTLEELAIEYGTTTKTIYRDLKERFSYLPIEKEKKYYFLPEYALGKLNLEDIKNFATISGIKSLYPTLTNQFLTDILDNKINKVYMVKNCGFEDIENKKEAFEKLSNAILNQNLVTFTYNDKNKIVEPYKLMNANGIWYLCANDDSKIKTYTLSKIKHLKLTNETFKPNDTLLKAIEKDETNWFSTELKEVILKIDNSAKEYFLRKKALANMQILEENEAYFIVSTKIAFDDEVLHLVKYWIPYIQIVLPIDLREKLNTVLKNYLKLDTPCPNTMLEFSK
jgi:predicted DNA-binding transcriptional regulator YafY